MIAAAPDRKSFSIISKLLLAGPRVASCFVDFLNLIGRTLIPIEGSIATPVMDTESFLTCFFNDDLATWLKLKPVEGMQ